MPKITKKGTYNLNESFGSTIENTYQYTKDDADNLLVWVKGNSTSNLIDGSPFGRTVSEENLSTLSNNTLSNQSYKQEFKSVRFNGTDSRFSVPDTDDLSFVEGAGNDEPFSVSMWVRFTDFSAIHGLFGKSNSGSTREYYGAVFTNGRVAFILYDNSANQSIYCYSSAGDVVANTWHHIVITYDGSENADGINIYVDGQKTTPSSKLTGGSYVGQENLSSPLYIGYGFVTSGDRYLKGDVAEFALWSKELTPNVTAALFHRKGYSAYESGYLNNPVRTIIRDRDNQRNTRPRIKRIGDVNSSFTLKPYRDENTVVYGEIIRDDFNLEANNPDQITRAIDTNKWVAANRLIKIRREMLADYTKIVPSPPGPGALIIQTINAVGAWIRTKNKVNNPSLKFTVLMGDYSFSEPGSLKLSRPKRKGQTLAVQVSENPNSGYITIPLQSKNISNPNVVLSSEGEIEPFFNRLNSLTNRDLLPRNSDGSRRPAFTVTLDRDQLKLPSSDSFYIRIIQNNPPSPKANPNFAIDNIEIVSRRQSLIAQTGLQRIHSNYLTGAVASPNFLSNLVTTNGNSLSHTFDDFVAFNNDNPTISIFDDTKYVIDSSNDFFTEAVKSRILPGFSSPLSSRKVLEIDLSPSTPTTFGYVNPTGKGGEISGLGGSSSTDLHDGEDGQQLMVYWNNILRKWEKKGRPLNYNNTPNPTGLTALSFLSQSCLGFTGVSYHLTGSGNSILSSTTKLLSREYYAGLNKPTDAAGFPFSGQYHATASQYILAKDLGITKPFLLEKCVLDFNYNLKQSSNGTGNNLKVYYGGHLNPPGSQVINSNGLQFITPTFFMLRQYPDSFTRRVTVGYTAASATPNSLSYDVTIPGNYHLNSGSSDFVRVADSRELITYGQSQFFLTSSTSGALKNLTIQPQDFIEAGYTGDVNIIRSNDTINPNPNTVIDSGNKQTVYSGSVRMPFPVRNCASYPNRFPLQVYDGSSGSPTTRQGHIRGFLLGKEVGSRTDTDLKYPRALINGVGPINRGDSIAIPDPRIPNTAAAFIADMATPETLVQDSPYILMPEDKIVFGWQYPPKFNQAQDTAGSDLNRRDGLELLGSSKLRLYGTEIKMNQQHESSLQQNLTSDVIYEVIGDEPVLDEFQVAMMGELTGSQSDKFQINLLDRTFSAGFSLVYGSLLAPNELDSNVAKVSRIIARFDSGTQQAWFRGTLPQNRIGVTNYSLSTIETTTPSLGAIGQGGRIFLRQLGSNLNLVDLSRTFVDSRLFELTSFGGKGSGNFQPVLTTAAQKVLTRPSYGSYQNISGQGNVTDKVRLGGSPKYYYSGKDFGMFKHFIRQGLDGTFVDDPTISSDDVTVESAIRVNFVSGTFDQKTAITNYVRVRPEFIDKTSEELFQSSNLSLFATSSLPFNDTGANSTNGPEVTNRNYNSTTLRVE